MSTRLKLVMGILYGAGIILLVGLVAGGHYDIAVLNPQGLIGAKERSLIVLSTLLMLIVVIPVFILTAAIAWNYREGNAKAEYAPDWDHHKYLELIWWGLPFAIIATLAVIAWKSSHDLDPFKPLQSQAKPITIQVVALQWKWLFLYPDRHIATVNYVEIPVNTPVDFEITSDAPMNSFWIPKLGGQIYAMSGMRTQLHLEANNPGDYQGVSANISGKGFADMHFVAKAVIPEEYEGWAKSGATAASHMNKQTYQSLAQPGVMSQPTTYHLDDQSLFDTILAKYMPSHETSTAHAHEVSQ